MVWKSFETNYYDELLYIGYFCIHVSVFVFHPAPFTRRDNCCSIREGGRASIGPRKGPVTYLHCTPNKCLAIDHFKENVLVALKWLILLLARNATLMTTLVSSICKNRPLDKVFNSKNFCNVEFAMHSFRSVIIENTRVQYVSWYFPSS